MFLIIKKSPRRRTKVSNEQTCVQLRSNTPITFRQRGHLFRRTRITHQVVHQVAFLTQPTDESPFHHHSRSCTVKSLPRSPESLSRHHANVSYHTSHQDAELKYPTSRPVFSSAQISKDTQYMFLIIKKSPRRRTNVSNEQTCVQLRSYKQGHSVYDSYY